MSIKSQGVVVPTNIEVSGASRTIALLAYANSSRGASMWSHPRRRYLD
jgi:hypothetical protein